MSEINLSRAEAADYIDRIADARSTYSYQQALHECDMFRVLADALRGKSDALVGLLPSWLWEQFGLTSFGEWAKPVEAPTVVPYLEVDVGSLGLSETVAIGHPIKESPVDECYCSWCEASREPLTRGGTDA